MSGISLKGDVLAQALDVAVAKKTIDAQKAEGEAAVALIEQAGTVAQAPPPLRANSPYLGQLIDTYM